MPTAAQDPRQSNSPDDPHADEPAKHRFPREVLEETKLGTTFFVPLGGRLMRRKPPHDAQDEIDPAWLRNYESEILYQSVKFVPASAVMGCGLLVYLLLHWFGD